jgi:hypothetical protein
MNHATPLLQIYPLYHIEMYPIGVCVCDAQGYNCLSFTDKPGAKFTTLEIAAEICREWNVLGRSNEGRYEIKAI